MSDAYTVQELMDKLAKCSPHQKVFLCGKGKLVEVRGDTGTEANYLRLIGDGKYVDGYE